MVAPGEAVYPGREPMVGRRAEQRRTLDVVLLEGRGPPHSGGTTGPELRPSRRRATLGRPAHRRRALTRRHHGPSSPSVPRHGLQPRTRALCGALCRRG